MPHDRHHPRADPVPGVITGYGPDSRGNMPSVFAITKAGVRYRTICVSGPCPQCRAAGFPCHNDSIEDAPGGAYGGLPGRTVWCGKCDACFVVGDDLGLSPRTNQPSASPWRDHRPGKIGMLRSWRPTPAPLSSPQQAFSHIKPPK